MELMEDNVYAPPKADLTRKHHDGEVTTLMIDHLQTAAKWARVLSVIGYLIVIGFFLFGIYSVVLLRSQIFIGDTVELTISILLFLISAFITFKISRFLQKYAYYNRQLLSSNDVSDLIEAQEYFRRYVKWLGVFSMISVALSLIMAIMLFVVGIGEVY